MNTPNDDVVIEFRDGAEVPRKANGGRVGSKELKLVDVYELLDMNIRPREKLLSPVFAHPGLYIIHAWRGVGKTYLALAIAYTVAAGGRIFDWVSPEPRKTVYVDGELPAALLQNRISRLTAASENAPDPGMLNILTPDLQDGPMPDLALLGGQAALNKALPPDVEFVVIDSLSSLVRGQGRENDAESWLPVANWAMSQRVLGRSVLFLHHDNRRGEQRGTSKKEDIVDVVLSLRRPSDHSPSGLARFEIHVEKSREMVEEFTPLDASLEETQDGASLWTFKPLQQTLQERIERMADDGMTKAEIADELKVARSTVYRALARRKG